MFDDAASALDDLAAALDGLAAVDPPSCGAAGMLEALATLVTLGRRLEAQAQRFLEAADRTEAYRYDGALSLPAWLAGRCHVSHARGRALVHAARARSDMPAATAAHVAGTVSLAHVQALARGLDDRTAASFAEYEAFLAEQAAQLTPEQTARVVRHWRAYVDPDGAHRPPGEQSSLSASTADGWLAVQGGFAGDDAAIVARALDRLAGPPDHRPLRQRRAAGLVELCDRYLRGEPIGGRATPHVMILVRRETLQGHGHAAAVTAEGVTLTRPELERFLRDATVRRVVVDADGLPVEVGESRSLRPGDDPVAVALAAPAASLVTRGREPMAAQWAALWVRDGTCSHPLCDAPWRRTDAHHLVDWDTGGPTALDNLALCCRRHHRLRHKHGWQVRLGHDGRPVWLRPAGTVVRSRPPPSW